VSASRTRAYARAMRRLATLVLVGFLAVVVIRIARGVRTPREPTPAGTAQWPPLRPVAGAEPAPTAVPEGRPVRDWMPPLADGACPAGFPVKAKRSSGIYHPPGAAAYERTFPDRCYPDAAAAEADGFRPAKR
jgi:hypothetical protein